MLPDPGYLVRQSAVSAWWCAQTYHWLADIARGWGRSGDDALPDGFDLRRLAVNFRIRRVIGEMTDADCVDVVHTRWHSNAPHSDGLASVAHQDSYDPHARTDCVRVWWFPQAVTPMNGPIWVAPGSQHADSPPDPQCAVPILVPAGGFVVVHGALWHWQGPNGTDDPRIMIRLEFAPARSGVRVEAAP